MHSAFVLKISVLPKLFGDKYLLRLFIYILSVYLTTFAVAQITQRRMLG
jgi:hypothetical protein